MNDKFPKIAFVLFLVAAVFLVIDGFLTGDVKFWGMAGIFLVLGLLFAIDMRNGGKNDE